MRAAVGAAGGAITGGADAALGGGNVAREALSGAVIGGITGGVIGGISTPNGTSFWTGELDHINLPEPFDFSTFSAPIDEYASNTSVTDKVFPKEYADVDVLTNRNAGRLVALNEGHNALIELNNGMSTRRYLDGFIADAVPNKYYKIPDNSTGLTVYAKGKYIYVSREYASVSRALGNIKYKYFWSSFKDTYGFHSFGEDNTNSTYFNYFINEASLPFVTP